MKKGTLLNRPSQHGERLHYRRGCRCVFCIKANTLYGREDRKKRNKQCFRNSHLKSNFGISLDQYNQKLEQQQGLCAVCHKTETKANQFGIVALAVDHDHTTGKIRGLLCMKCNRALGMLGDSVETISNLLKYRSKY